MPNVMRERERGDREWEKGEEERELCPMVKESYFA